MTFTGLLPSRSADILAVGGYYAHVSNSARDAQRDANRVAAGGGTPNNLAPGPLPDFEAGLDVNYQISIAPWWTLQPDFQYVIHPGGSSAYDNAVVIGLRTIITF
jgi:porin